MVIIKTISYHEIVYTTTITIISTAVMMAFSFGLGKILDSIGYEVAIDSATGLALTGGKEGMMNAALSGMSITSGQVVKSIIIELGQELLLDPIIESSVGGAVRRAGGNSFWQMIASSVAEAAREAITGPVSRLFSSEQQQRQLLMVQLQNLHQKVQEGPVVQQTIDQYNQLRENFAASENQRKLDMTAIGKSLYIISLVIKARSSTNVVFHGPVDAMSTKALKFVADTEAVSIKSLFEKKFEYKSDLYSDYTSMLSREIRTGPFGVYSGFHMKKSYDGPIKTPNIENNLQRDKPYRLTQRLDAIVNAWHELIDIIKVSLDYTNLKSVSNFLDMGESYISGVQKSHVLYNAKGFTSLIDDKKALEIYYLLENKQKAFGESWSKVSDKFNAFWAVRFGVNFEGKNYIDSIEETWSSGHELDRGIKSIFAKHLTGFSENMIPTPYISRLLSPHSPNSITNFKKSGGGIRLYKIFQLISEVRDLTVTRLIDSTESSGAWMMRLKKENIKDLKGLRAELEKFLVMFLMTGKTGVNYNPNSIRKMLLNLEIFYPIYKSKPLNERKTFSLESVKQIIGIFATDKNLNSKASGFRIMSKFTYSWDTIRTLTLFMREAYINGEISRNDYKSFIREKRRFCQEFGISPHRTRPTSNLRTSGETIQYNPKAIQALKNTGFGSLKKVSDYMLKQSGKSFGGFLSDYYDALKVTKKTFSASSFSENPYSQNLGFSSQQRLDYIKKIFVPSILNEYGTTSGDGYIKNLIDYAKLRETDTLVATDAHLLKIISPSGKSRNYQPSHDFIQDLALKNNPSIVATEFWLWKQIGNTLLSGHIDLLRVDTVGKKIQILDYKPELNYNPNAKSPSRHFIDSVPQLAAYGVLLDMLFGIKASGFDIECVTFNEQGYYLFEPYKALESSVKFYWDSIQYLPAWAIFLSKSIIYSIKSQTP